MKKALVRAAAVTFATASIGVGINALVAQAAVPNCVGTSTWSSGAWNYADASNDCSSAQRLYFRWDRAVDGGCNTLRANDGYRWEGRLYQARFAGLSSC
jgi:hypothetical protein